MTYAGYDFDLFVGTVDFLSCLFGDFLPHLASIALQPSQHLPSIHLSNIRIGVLPEFEEFLLEI